MLKTIQLSLAAALFACGPAFAADTKISAEPAATTLTGAELIPCVQGATNSKCTAAQVSNFSNTGYSKVVGRFYQPVGVGQNVAGNAPLINTAVCALFLRDTLFTSSNIAFRVSGAEAGNYQLAIYAAGTDGDPTGTAVVSTASVSTTPAGTNITAFSGAATVQVGPGSTLGSRYFVCINTDVTTAFRYHSSPALPNLQSSIGSSSGSNALSATPTQAKQTAQTFGTWPDLTSAVFTDVITLLSPAHALDVTTIP